MTITANTQSTNLLPQNLASGPRCTDGLWLTLGAELVYTQDTSGRYLTFAWQHSEAFGLGTEIIVDQLNQEEEKFTPVDRDAYLEQLHGVLTSLVPSKVEFSFNCNQQLLELELTITPIMPQLGQAATIVLVMGRLLSTKTGSSEVNRKTKIPTVLDLALRSQRHQKLLNQIIRNIRRTLDPEIIWQQTADSLGKALNLSHCIICPYQPHNSKLQVIAEYHHPDIKSVLGSEIGIATESVFAQVLATLEPRLIETPSYINNLHQTMLVVATSYQEQANGLVAFNLVNECLPLTPSELDLAKEVGDQIGTAIAHANLYKELEAARQKAEDASRLKSHFLASVSHEIRTPLNGIINFLQFALDEDMADTLEERNLFLNDAHKLSLHLLNVLNDILDIAKIEAGKMEISSAPVELGQLFSKVETSTRPQAEKKNLSFHMYMPSTSEPILVQGDDQRLLQVMLNLVGNAIKFTDEGSIIISVDLIIRKGRHKSPGMVKVRVIDTGIGVSLEKQSKLFQLFSQVDGSLTRQYGGTGLGLTISQKLIEAMGGEVNFFSLGEGLGSTVTFTVPLYQKPYMNSASESELGGIHAVKSANN